MTSIKKDIDMPMDVFEKCARFTAAQDVIKAGIYPFFQPIESSDDTVVTINGERKVMVGSNNYLGLTHHPYVLERAKAAMDRYGSGCTGSRFLNGTLDLHVELEARLAAFMGHESCVIFSTGYQTNLGAISTLVGRGGVIIQDRLNHASLVDGALLAAGDMVRYPHGRLDILRRALQKHAGAPGGVLVVTDGVFSMEGDIVDLPSIVPLVEEYGARLLVDDAHAAGVLGERGRGTAEHFGMLGRVDLTMVTFSKSFASIGGAFGGPEQVIHYLKHHARPLIFSASMPPSAIATVLACLDVIEREPERLERLWENADYLRRELRRLGFDTLVSETPIIPVVVGETLATFSFWKSLFDAGIFTNPVLPPAVPAHSCRLRTSVMATHTRDHLDQVLEAFAFTGRRHGLI